MNQMYIGGARSRSVGLGERSPPSALNLTLAFGRTRNVLTLPSTPRIAICITFQSTAVMFPRPFLGAASPEGTRGAAAATATARRQRIRVIGHAPLFRNRGAVADGHDQFTSKTRSGRGNAGAGRVV